MLSDMAWDCLSIQVCIVPLGAASHAGEAGDDIVLPDLAAHLGDKELQEAAQDAMWAIFTRHRQGDRGGVRVHLLMRACSGGTGKAAMQFLHACMHAPHPKHVPVQRDGFTAGRHAGGCRAAGPATCGPRPVALDCWGERSGEGQRHHRHHPSSSLSSHTLPWDVLVWPRGVHHMLCAWSSLQCPRAVFDWAFRGGVCVVPVAPTTCLRDPRVNELMAAGCGLMNAGSHPRAISAFNQVIQLAPTYAEV